MRASTSECCRRLTMRWGCFWGGGCLEGGWHTGHALLLGHLMGVAGLAMLSVAVVLQVEMQPAGGVGGVTMQHWSWGAWQRVHALGGAAANSVQRYTTAAGLKPNWLTLLALLLLPAHD